MKIAFEFPDLKLMSFLFCDDFEGDCTGASSNTIVVVVVIRVPALGDLPQWTSSSGPAVVPQDIASY